MKKITLTIAAIAAAFTMNAQDSCADAEGITVGADDSTTISVDPLAGDTPDTICISAYYDETEITSAAWYSYTPTEDLVVTVFSDVPTDAENEYVPSFNVYTGSCGDLVCLGGNLITSDGTNLYPAESSFIAEAGEDYYIVFDDYYATTAGLGVNVAFDFEVSTSTDVPDAPEAAENPTPADGDTGVVIDDDNEMAVAFSWSASATGGEAESYAIFMGNAGATSLSEMNLLGNTANTSVNITGMEYDTEYTWAVVPQNVAGIPDEADIEIWSFTTEENMSVEGVAQNQFSHYVSNGQLNLSANAPIESVELYSILGQQVVAEELSNNNESINISQLQTGVYLAKVQVEGQTKTFKFVK